ncbi:hypothetical protein, partial [Chromobacterium haemolyticum]|uniref:hypothetical protein n=1 Tax=Chromobacterium haemolyticum TaxID=394935 RepID=UPI00307CCEAB
MPASGCRAIDTCHRDYISLIYAISPLSCVSSAVNLYSNSKPAAKAAAAAASAGTSDADIQARLKRLTES